ncbi:MAG: zf-HC2 domain-containing protein [Anaerolineales bacterium]|nr:zf-HC2 domain-containing protein [Anaerolineales bacterium]
MSDHVTEWLPAYHDDELSERQKSLVRSHLDECAECRQALEQLQNLSSLLQSSPPAENLMPPDQFVAQIGLRLERRPEKSAWNRTLKLGWQLVPAGLLGAWTFIQIVFALSGATLIAFQLGFGGDLLVEITRMLPGMVHGNLSGFGQWLPGDLGWAVMNLMNHISPLVWIALINLTLSTMLGLLYWSWLASWLVSQRRYQPITIMR